MAGLTGGGLENFEGIGGKEFEWKENLKKVEALNIFCFSHGGRLRSKLEKGGTLGLVGSNVYKSYRRVLMWMPTFT